MSLYNGFGSVIVLPDGGSTGEKGSSLNEKTWFPIGDSITNMGSYTELIIRRCGIKKKLLGGYADGMQCGYASGENYCILSKIARFPDEKPDIVTIALGTNDYMKTPMGTIDDDPADVTAENYTFYGCYKKLISEVFALYGRVPMLLITPFPRNGGKVAGANGHTLEDYADAIVEIGKYYSIPVCDMYRYSGLSIGTLTDTKNGEFYYSSDGLHLAGPASAVVCPKIAREMEWAITEWVDECEYLNQYTGGNYVGSPVNIAVGETAWVYAVREDTTHTLTWESSNPDVATVLRSAGNYAACSITGVSVGNCVVTCTCGTATLDYQVNVTA